MWKNKKPRYCEALFDPEAFHTEIYKKLYHNHVVSLVKVQTQG